MAIELFRMPESEAVRVGLGLRLQSVDGGLRTVRHIRCQDYGTRCEFSDGSWRKVRRDWDTGSQKYRYFAEE